MTRLVGGSARTWMLCAVALLWAWEAAADDPVPAPVETVTASDASLDLSILWAVPAAAIDRIRGGR